MSSAEMKNWFLQECDRVTNLTAPGYDDYEISVFLTNAQKQFIEKKYEPLANRYGDGFEGSEKHRRALASLVVDAINIAGSLTTGISANQNGAHPNGVFFDIPSDTMYIIEDNAIITGSVCIPTGYGQTTISGVAGKRVDVKPVTHNYVNANRFNPFKFPDEWLLWRLDYSDAKGYRRVELIGDGTFTIAEYRMRYIRKVKPIITGTLPSGKTIEGYGGVLSSELDDVVHAEIVRMAVDIALENFGDPRYRTHKVETVTTET